MKNFILLTLVGILYLNNYSKAQINDFPWHEPFDNTEISSNWSQELISGEALWVSAQGGFLNTPPQAYAGNRNALFSSPSYEQDETILVSPEFDFSNTENPRISFWHAQYNWDDDQDELVVLYKEGIDGDWVEIASYLNSVNAWTLRSMQIPSTNNSVYIGFKAKSGYGYGVVIDELVVDDAPECSEPENVEITNTSTESVSIAWNSDAVLWQIEYGENGFVQGEGSIINNIVNQQYTISGLEENTNYNCYVRSVCAGNYSDWVGPLNFTTNCYPLVVNNYFEGFEGNSAPPSCWSLVYTNPDPPAANLVSLTTTQAFEGEKSFRFSSYAPGPPYDQYLISPEIQNYFGEREFRFWFRRYSSGSESFRIGYSTSGDNLTTDFTWTNFITYASPQWQLYSMDLPEGVKYIVIHYNTVFQYYLYIDNLQIRIPPTCPQPENLVADNITAISAHINWVPVGNEEEWTLSYGLNGFSPNEGTIIYSENPTYVINSLNPNTSYQVYVRSNCTEDNSAWTGPVSFTTPYGCEQVTNIYANELNSESVEITWSPAGSEESWNIEYGLNGFVQGTGTVIENHPDNSLIISDLVPNADYDVYIQSYCGEQFGTSLWSNVFQFKTLPCDNGCNFNLLMTDTWGDGWGDNYLEVYQDGELTSVHTLISGASGNDDIYICEGALVALKITPTTYASEIGMELLNPYGESLFTLIQGSLPNGGQQQTLTTFSGTCEEPECYPPSNIIIDNISYESARVAYLSYVESSSVSISYGAEGILPEEGTIINNIETDEYLLQGLIANTDYSVYVSSNCETIASNWSGPYLFTTAEVQLDNPSLCGVDIAIPDNDCISISIDVSGIPYNSLGMDVVLDEVWFIIDHEFNDDIDMWLISPSGAQTLLFSDVGDDATGFGISDGTCSQYTSLNMYGADGNINAGEHPFVGSYIPEGNYNELYDGTDPNGFWTLLICDDAAFFTGSLQYVELVFAAQKYMMWSDNIFIESTSNDGSIGTTIQVELFNENFANQGVLQAGVDYIFSGVPEGLEFIVEAENNTEAILFFSGNALNHANINDVTNLSISFTDNAFEENNAEAVLNSEQNNMIIDFKNLTDIANLSPVPDVQYVCLSELNNQQFDYTFVNTGENIIPQNTNIHVKIEYPQGTIALHETIVLENALNPGSEIFGTTQNSVFFGDIGAHNYKLIIQAPADIIPSNDTLSGTFVGISQEIVFPGSENDSLMISEYPAIVAAYLELNPDSSLNHSFYWQGGISTSNSIDVVSDGWYTCIITTEACAIVDSVFVYYFTDIDNLVETSGFNLYPNPAKDIITIEGITDTEQVVYLKIFDLQGKIYRELETENYSKLHSFQIDVNDFYEGMYIIELRTENKRWFKKLIIDE
jgi:hypothetical protein